MADYTSFVDDGNTEARKYLYKLEQIGIFRMVPVKKGKWTSYKWQLTKEGKKITESNEHYKKLLLDRRFEDFYKEIKKIKVFDLKN